MKYHMHVGLEFADHAGKRIVCLQLLDAPFPKGRAVAICDYTDKKLTRRAKADGLPESEYNKFILACDDYVNAERRVESQYKA